MKDDLDWDGFLERKRLKKSEAARLIGAAPAMMTDWMNGKTQPSRKYLKKLCEAGMTAQEMFGEEAGNTLIRNSVDVKSESAESAKSLDSDAIRSEVLKILDEINMQGKIQEITKGKTLLDRKLEENSPTENI